MSEYHYYRILLWGWLVVAVGVFTVLFFITAPYGRHVRKGWGLGIDSRWGWCMMEAPAALGFGLWFVLGGITPSGVLLVFFIMWQVHYVYRAFIYPRRLREWKKQMPVLIVGLALFFNLVNSYLNGRYLFKFSGGYSTEWFYDLRFIGGVVLFVFGFFVNHQSDEILLRLRNAQESEYKIPHGGLYRWVSCPNYFGEIIEWMGWSLATWSWPGLVFAVWTAANLVPRARSHHRWYKEQFPDYPHNRKILIPFLW
jgi:protein-S-isoprenylcysteine O-methyltransferase Ste14